MKRLTQKDEQGNWSLRVVLWESLHEGRVITKELQERLYGALWKLMEYEDTGLTPEQVEDVNDFNKSQVGHLLKKLSEEQRKHRRIPVKERLPEDDNYILLSFENFDIPLIGRYEADAERQKQTGAWQERKLGVEVKSMDYPYCDYIHDCTEDCEECEIYDDYLDDINDLY